jgi:hypothetical protein
MKCKEESYPSRLYARSEDGSTTWMIITNKNSHNCRRPSGDRKHLQLTSNLIVGCVRQHLKKTLSNSATNQYDYRNEISRCGTNVQ